MQSTSFFNRPQFTVTSIPVDRDKAVAFMQSMANMAELKRQDITAWAKFEKQLETRTWQEVDVDVCRELELLDCIAYAEDVAAMRRGE